MNGNHRWLTRRDRWFQLHPPVWAGRALFGRDQAHWDFLATCNVPLYMRYPQEEFPTAVPYPIEEVSHCVGRRYFTSSPAYGLALAIYEEVDEIKLYGVNLASNTEYVEQRPCIEWLLGLAEGRGIKVEAPDDSPLLKGAEYPVNVQGTPQSVAQNRLDERRKVYNRYWAKLHQAIGVIHAMRELQRDGMSAEQIEDAFRAHAQEVSNHLNMTKGEIVEAKFWLTQSGGFDRHASVMPHQSVPPGYLSPSVMEMIEEAQIEG